MTTMVLDDLVVLIPCHTLEDFPRELGEKEAASILNAFAVAWHPLLLNSAGIIPRWQRADEPPEVSTSRLVIVPTASDGWMPCGWVDRAREQGAAIVSGVSERGEMLAAALSALAARTTSAPDNESANGPAEAIDPDLAADFMALGTCYLQLELLTRQMHHYSSIDEVQLQREAIAAAQAAISNDAEATRAHLRSCFEALLESRERFYPVECYLIDLCLLTPEYADEHLESLLSTRLPSNILITAKDLDRLSVEKPELFNRLHTSWAGEQIEICGGEWQEGPATLLPIESLIESFQRGRAAYERLCDQAPTTWARRRFGLSTQHPQILTRLGYKQALHLLLDDGIYPDSEHSKLRWEGSDSSAIDAISRIPLATDAATSFLRFPARMAETMEQDHAAATLFARWPKVETPWWDDFQRIQKYFPTLGRFVTFARFFELTESPGRVTRHEAQEYLSPFLIDAVARRQANPISRYREYLALRRKYDAGHWYRSMAELLCGRPLRTSLELTHKLDDAGPDAAPEAVEPAKSDVEHFVAESKQKLADVVMSGAGAQSGLLTFNPLSFTRRVAIDVGELATPPKIGGPVKNVQWDDRHKFAIVDLPPSGYVWISGGDDNKPEKVPSSASMVEDDILRNEFFELHLNRETGGIARIKEFGRKPNRLSQQLAYRFSRERRVQIGEEFENTHYSEMRCTDLRITSAGPVLAEAVSTGDLVDQVTGSRLAGFQQRFRVWRGRRLVELDIELDVDMLPDGNPWTNYYATRFAWNASDAALTRSVLQGAHGFTGERFESLHYLEIADDTERTTITCGGLPFHRKSGNRMADTLLVAAGETARHFRFGIWIDAPYPLECGLDLISPIDSIATSSGPPRSGPSGWFIQLDVRNVQLLQLLEPAEPAADEGKGFAVRLLETEGRLRPVRLTCWRSPVQAWQRDLIGRKLTDLRIDGDAVIVQMQPYEIADVELRFDS